MWSVRTNNNVIWWRTWKMAMTERSKCIPSTECSDGSSHSQSCMTLHCWAGSNGRIKQLTYYYWFLPPYGNTPPGIRNYSGLSLIWYTVYGRETNYYKKKSLFGQTREKQKQLSSILDNSEETPKVGATIMATLHWLHWPPSYLSWKKHFGHWHSLLAPFFIKAKGKKLIMGLHKLRYPPEHISNFQRFRRFACDLTCSPW